ncbi:VWA domain-containing protein [soil metagenome]
MAEQLPYTPLPDIGFADNTQQRCPCVLLVDTSGSMGEIVSRSGASLGYTIQQDGQTYNAVSGGTTRIDLVNEGLRAYQADLMSDTLASLRVEVSIITFGGKVETVMPFTTARDFTPPPLQASGETPMGAAILQSIDAVEERKRVLKQNGIDYLRPWIFLITDGAPNHDDPWKSAAEKVLEGEASKKFSFFAVGVEGANFEILGQFSKVRQPAKLKGYSFKEMFLWLSSSQRAMSQSSPGQEQNVVLPPPGWTSV